jgi:RNA polymerase sigma-70 factor (ECF subfamily)
VTPSFPISLLDSARLPDLRSNQKLPTQTKAGSDDVLAKAQAGDSDAFSRLYLQHRKRVFSICLRMVRDFSIAEDLTQETFLQLHRKLATFRGESVFTTWLHRMTVNIVLMRLRKRVLPVVSLDGVLISVAPDEEIVRSFGARDLTQAGVVDRLAIERAVATLPPGYRAAYILHDVQGFQHREIADMQSCTMGTSKSQLHKARRALRSALSPQRVKPIPRQVFKIEQIPTLSGASIFKTLPAHGEAKCATS